MRKRSCSIYDDSLKTRRLYCVEWTQYSIRPKRSAIIQEVFPWAHPRPRRKRHLDRFSRHSTRARTSLNTALRCNNCIDKVSMGICQWKNFEN